MSADPEKHFTSALNNKLTAEALAALLQEAEAALATAEQEADTAHALAFDPVRSPDPVKAKAEMEQAAFARDRLKALLPRLQQRHQQMVAQELAVCWNATADQVQVQRDALANEFAETYPALVNGLVDLFERLRAMDEEVFRVNVAAPNAENRRLSRIGQDPIISATKLFISAGQQVWPPPTPLQMAAPILPGPGPDWHQALAQRDCERRAESQRMVAYYAQQAKEREDREAAEARAVRLRLRNEGSP